MPEVETPDTDSQRPAAPASRQGLEALASGSEQESLKQILTKPVSLVAMGLGVAIIGLVIFLQQDPRVLTLEIPEVRFELLPNEGVTQGVPIAIRMGHLMVFQISDPVTGAAGAARAKRIVASLNQALDELVANPPRVITIQSSTGEGLQMIVQKEYTDSEEFIEIVSVTADDMALAKTDDAKLLARIWAERLTDSMRLLIFGEPPEFSRDSPFGRALDTLYVNAANEAGALTTDALDTAFEGLPVDLQKALTENPPEPPPINILEDPASESGS